MFIFDRCRRSSVAVTAVKYESDSRNLKSTFFKIENFATEKSTNGALVSPILGLTLVHMASPITKKRIQQAARNNSTRRGVFRMWTNSSMNAEKNVSTMENWNIQRAQVITMTSDGHQGVSNYLQLDCLFNHTFRPTIKKTPVLSITGPLWREFRWLVFIPLTKDQQCCHVRGAQRNKMQSAWPHWSRTGPLAYLRGSWQWQWHSNILSLPSEKQFICHKFDKKTQ